MILEITGSDALKVLNNLTTNQLADLAVGNDCETFVTDLRGWTVAHGFIHHTQHGVRLLGQHPQPEVVCNHIDRYIIREDARVKDLSVNHALLLVDGAADEATLKNTLSGLMAEPLSDWHSLFCPLLGPTSQLCYGPADVSSAAALQELSGSDSSNARYELLRIRNFWPRMGQDIGEKCIPQELDRDAQAISFTKGCYLGQETIARLDARGQLQKKLCRVRIAADGIQPQSSLQQGEKEVGRITSAAYDPVEEVTYALAFIRRGCFEPGTELHCQQVLATVLPPR